MIISIDAEKDFDKIQHLFMIKNPLENRHRGNIPQHNKSYIWQIHSKHYPQWWKIESISLGVRKKTRVPTYTTTIQHSFGSFSHNREEKEIKGFQIGKWEVKLSLFAEDMILYIENTKDTTIKWLELINEYSKVAGYEINTQKSLAFLYNNNEKTEREIKEAIPFTIAMKRIKYLGKNLAKETKDLYIENYKNTGERNQRWHK